MVVALDIGGTKIAGALIDVATFEVCERRSVPTDAKRGGEAVLQTALELVAGLAAFAEQAGLSVAGIGVATAGVVDPATGAISSASDIMPGWQGQQVRACMEERFGVPAAVLNDVQAHALGEAHFGAARGKQSCLCVGIGTGLGGAFVLDGQVVRGFHGAAGHVGHTLHHAAAGADCSCGHVAHAECVTSGTAISAIYQGRSLDEPLDPALMGDTVAARAAAGEARAAAVLHDAGFALGEAIGSWCNILDPECVVLSGTVTNAGPIWRDAVQAGFASQVLPPLADTPLLDGQLGGDAPLLGAAYESKGTYPSDPLKWKTRVMNQRGHTPPIH